MMFRGGGPYLGDGVVTDPLASEKGEGGTTPTVGRKYFR